MTEISKKIKIIHGSNVKDFNEKEKQRVNMLLNEYYVRIQRMLKNLVSIEFNIKKYEKAGRGKEDKEKIKKASVHARVDSAAGVFEADYADWDLARTVHKVMNKLINEIEHKMHSSDQHDRARRSQKIRERDGKIRKK